MLLNPCLSRQNTHSLTRYTLLLIILALLCGVPSYAQQDTATYVSNEALVIIAPDKDDDGLAARLAFVGTETGRISDLHIHRLKLAPGLSVTGAINLLKQLSDVVSAQPNYIMHGGSATPSNDPAFTSIDTNPNSPRYNQTFQWGPQQIQANLAWNIWQPKQSVYIAILDTGIDYTHPDLANKMYRDSNGTVIGYNVGLLNTHDNTTTSFIDDNGHGTFNAGIAAAQANNSIGVAGIAGWNGIAGQTDVNSVKLIPVKVLDNSNTSQNAFGTGTSFSFSQGINWVRGLNVNGHKVINMSFGGTPPDIRDDAVAYAVSAAWNAGCVLAAAAGNNGTPDQVWPANLSHVISVAASDSTDTLGGFSEYGSWVNVAAPGVNIYSTSPTYSVYLNTNSQFGFSQNYSYLPYGTSFACPHVAGEAALLWSQNPSLTNRQVHDFILNNTDPVTPYPGHGSIGGGRVNAYKALIAATPHGSDVKLLAAGNYLYGTTLAGGAYSRGAIFQVDPNSQDNHAAGSVLYSFTGGTDGAHPFGGLILGQDGYLYGTCSQGGQYGLGTVFRLLPSGSNFAVVLHIGAYSGGSDAYGSNPRCALQELASGGTFVGVTPNGGSSHLGTVFATSSAGGFLPLYSFVGGASDGVSPTDGVTLGSDGYYWGVTTTGGRTTWEPCSARRTARQRGRTALRISSDRPAEEPPTMARTRTACCWKAQAHCKVSSCPPRRRVERTGVVWCSPPTRRAGSTRSTTSPAARTAAHP